MSDGALRGTRLGATSYENDDHVELAPRQVVHYDCPTGTPPRMPFSVEAEVPAIWECRTCGAEALIRDGERPEAKPTKHVRTHWDMLLERRTHRGPRGPARGASRPAPRGRTPSQARPPDADPLGPRRARRTPAPPLRQPGVLGCRARRQFCAWVRRWVRCRARRRGRSPADLAGHDLAAHRARLVLAHDRAGDRGGGRAVKTTPARLGAAAHGARDDPRARTCAAAGSSSSSPTALVTRPGIAMSEPGDEQDAGVADLAAHLPTRSWSWPGITVTPSTVHRAQRPRGGEAGPAHHGDADDHQDRRRRGTPRAQPMIAGEPGRDEPLGDDVDDDARG